MPDRFDLIIDDLIEFYSSELTIIEALSRQSVGANSSLLASEASKKVAQNERTNRIAISEIIKRTAKYVTVTSFKKVFEFYITKGCLDMNEAVAKCSMEAAIKVIQEKGSLYAEEILKILDKQINEQSKNSEQSKNQAIIMIGFLANYLDNTSQKKLLGTFERMLEHLSTPSEFLRQSICKCISQLARFFDDKSKKTLEENFNILRQSNDEKLLRGSAYAVAGIVKGLGCLNNEMLEIVQKECFSKNSD
jgi:hypothetical protein